MTRPLEGLLVVSLEQAVAAPTCTMRLADAGARVIKLERIEGDTARHYDRSVKGISAYFAWLNRGKESAALDLKSEEDLALAHALVAKADVFVQNLAPGASVRLGLGARDLVARHPRLIALDIVGYRQSTPARGLRAYDMLVQAESGICSVTGTPDEAVKVGVSIADIGTGMNAHAAVLQALYERERTGRGKAIEIAMFDSMAEWMAVPFLHYEHQGRITPRTGLSHASIFPYHVADCVDGGVVIVVQSPAEWVRFCEGALGRPDLVADPRFADNPLRVENREALAAIIQETFGPATRAAMIERLEAHQLAWAKVSDVRDMASHPALTRMTATLASGETFDLPTSPLTAATTCARPPELGEHTAAIRAEVAAALAPAEV
ncbi:crotonobetainyl-CoA:carnitine CoA-transferase CaiB-like acyl-CoA transferase [Methylopila capsulata]|uniref:CoA transferase n=1 Tax=Methylopila capsulata TaxID=61654 RepID=A0A9W6MRM5_9HYPH|nr:CaiB/BaiF CoA-transferase family protein [Methylopila capsulata]MBM7850117.1 crotonobetainyl-CoA:carnitine CoA-transferase CaiB-like acyl-CoA transferase [Methylopila capsulata]GLK55408.1 CoA transferase [Methylopila capsulata]